MTTEYKNLPEQLVGYSGLVQKKLEEYQADLLGHRSSDTPDAEKLSRIMGAIYAIGMYEVYLDIMFGNEDNGTPAAYGLIDREHMNTEYGYDMTEEEFDAWVEEQQDWFIESATLPAGPSTLPCIMNWLDDFLTNELLLPDSTLNLQAHEKASEEFADYDMDALRQGMLGHLEWIRSDLVPALMPPAWSQDDAPEAYKNIALGGLKRHLN